MRFGQTGGRFLPPVPAVPPILPRLLLVLSALFALPASAAPSTYSGRAPVASQADADRAGALRAAFSRVFAQQAGGEDVLARPEVADVIARANQYVLQYSYEPNREGGEKPLVLVAEFDADAVDRLLQKLGLGMYAGLPATAVDAPSEARVWIHGVDDADDYVRVMGYLGHNNFVRSARPVGARGDGLLVQLSLTTSLAAFVDVVGFERTLAVVDPTDGADAAFTLVR